MPGEVPVAVSVCVIVLPLPLEAPLTPDWPTVHEKVVPPTLLVKLIEVALPEQMACEAGVAVRLGTGFTVTVAVPGAPEHDPMTGVIVYTAVPLVTLVVVNVCEIVVPEPFDPPATPDCVTVQVKEEPATWLLRLSVVVAPEQMDCEVGVTVNTGVGLIVTLTVCDEPAQLPPVEVGVTVYTTTSLLPVVLVIVLLMVLVVCVVVLSPVVFGLFAATQVNVEATFAVSGMLTVCPLQIVADDALVMTGTGFTVTVAVIGAPGHVPAVGVMVYVAVPAVLVAVLSVCAIVEPLLFDAPVTPLWPTVHAKVVPVTLLVSEILVVPPEQMLDEAGVAVAVGVGFTVTVTTMGVPAQVFAVGVMV